MDEQDSKYLNAQLAWLFEKSSKASEAAREMVSQGLAIFWINRRKWPSD